MDSLKKINTSRVVAGGESRSDAAPSNFTPEAWRKVNNGALRCAAFLFSKSCTALTPSEAMKLIDGAGEAWDQEAEDNDRLSDEECVEDDAAEYGYCDAVKTDELDQPAFVSLEAGDDLSDAQRR